MDEVSYMMTENFTVGTVCMPDITFLGPELIKWMTIIESLWIYIIPFMITLVTDFAVLIFTRENKWYFWEVYSTYSNYQVHNHIFPGNS